MTEEATAPVEGTTVDVNVNGVEGEASSSINSLVDHGETNGTEEVSSETNKQTDIKDYGYVPEKFIGEDGQPDFENLAKSYKSLETMMSKKGVKIPNSVDEYKYDFKEGIITDFDASEKFREQALEQGVSAEQYSWLMGWFETSAIDSNKTSMEGAEESLRTSWGDNYDNSLEQAKTAWIQFGEGEIPPELGNHPEFLKVLSKMGGQLGEDSSMSQPTVQPTGLTRLEADEIMKSDDYYQNPEKQRLISEYYQQNVK